MIATKDCEHNGRTYVAGECFQAEPIHAAALKQQRKADYAERVNANRRQYRRRDMVAER